MNHNDSTIVGYIDFEGELQHFKFDFHNLPLGSGIRASRVAELDRIMEALKGQGLKCGRWTLECWARGWGRAALLRPKANFANGVG
jgi:hypothetical protein